MGFSRSTGLVDFLRELEARHGAAQQSGSREITDRVLSVAIKRQDPNPSTLDAAHRTEVADAPGRDRSARLKPEHQRQWIQRRRYEPVL